MATLSVRTQARLWLYQRISAMVLALFVAVHIGIIVYAVQGGLSAAEILSRSRGSVGFAVFYGLFVLACAVHAPIGLLRIAEEWLRWRGPTAIAAALAFGLLLAVMGLRAVYGVVS
jgi:fumarate reductase subunit C